MSHRFGDGAQGGARGAGWLGHRHTVPRVIRRCEERHPPRIPPKLGLEPAHVAFWATLFEHCIRLALPPALVVVQVGLGHASQRQVPLVTSRPVLGPPRRAKHPDQPQPTSGQLARPPNRREGLVGVTARASVVKLSRHKPIKQAENVSNLLAAILVERRCACRLTVAMHFFLSSEPLKVEEELGAAEV